MVAEGITSAEWDSRGVRFRGTNAQPVVGNGAVISPDGYVLTARHVIHRALRDGSLKPWLLMNHHGGTIPLPDEMVWSDAEADVWVLPTITVRQRVPAW